ncbi:MAG: STY4526/YPO1902 family pathogenicity island replication protein [bacterium]
MRCARCSLVRRRSRRCASWILADLYRVGTLQAHCLAIRLDRDVFWPMIANLRATREAEELQRDLIEADAPLEMMRSLFGVGSREYTRLRRMLALEPAVGRPPEPDEETSHKLWRALSAHLQPDADEALDPKQYLAVHEESGAPMRAIWNLAQRWLEYGDVYACADQASAAKESRAGRARDDATGGSRLSPVNA